MAGGRSFSEIREDCENTLQQLKATADVGHRKRLLRELKMLIDEAHRILYLERIVGGGTRVS
jgi:hypothetical protein